MEDSHECYFRQGTLDLQTGWDSRYVVEGRDVLDQESIFFGEVAWNNDYLGAGLWYGSSSENGYDELQLSVEATKEFGHLDTYLGYTHLRFPDDGAHDHEIGFGFALGNLPYAFICGGDLYYSIEEEGYFTEFYLSREYQVEEDWLLSFTGVLGINQSYVSDGHDGLNHFSLQTVLSYQISEYLAARVHCTCNIAIDADPRLAGDEQLDDFIFGGIVLNWRY